MTDELPDLVCKEYDTHPPYFGHRYRPADWPADKDYMEIFYVRDRGKWFGAIESKGGGQGSTSFDSKKDAEDFIWKHVQFTRRFWDQKVEWANNNDHTLPDLKKGERSRQVVRIDGQHYVVGHEPTQQELKDNRQFGGLGHGGHEFKIRLNDGTEITTRNLWAQGKIPEEYRPLLPDNAEFI